MGNYFKLFLILPTDEEMDENGDGTITSREMKERLTATKNYSEEEIEFLLACTEGDHEGKIEYAAFKETYYEPSKAIGFNMAVLLTNLSEHMTNDPRLAKFLETAASVLNFFEAFLGRIEIKTADKVERVYFEIDEANIEEWEKPQIRESKNAFFHTCISEGEGERMEQFVDFCEDAIFEMQISTSLSGEGEEEKKEKAALVMPGDDEPRGIIAPLQENIALGVESGKKLLSPENISAGIAKFQAMTPLEKILGLLTLVFYIVYGIGLVTLWINTKVGGTVLHLMRGKAKEKEYVASLFCKLANLLRQKKSAFGADAPQAVKCLQILIKAVDARSLAKSRPDFVRTSMLTFFNNGASDLEKTIANLRQGKYPLLRGTHIKTCTSLKYIFDVLGPVFISRPNK